MKILYIFPHPDDESFGPAPGIFQQLKCGHEVHLLTLTKGGATRIRHDLGFTIEQMGEVRLEEMKCVAKTLGLSGMTVLDLPDSGLKNMNPLKIEQVIMEHIEQLQPQIVVTYAVHGISGFHDHLVSHATVKRVFCHMLETGHHYLKRLAFFTLGPDTKKNGPFNLQSSEWEEIDCILNISEDEAEAGLRALSCYKTYQQVIEKTGIADLTSDDIHFEFFNESFHPVVNDITEGIKD